MVRKLGLAGLAVSVLLSLGACQVLFIGVFSGAAGQTTARRDLSSVVAPAAASYFNLAAVTAGGRDFVLLFSSMGFDASQVHLVIMDADLKVLGSYTNNDMPPLFGTTMLQGSAAVGDTNGDIVVGNLRFDAGPASPTPLGTAPVQLNGSSVILVPLYPYIETNFRISSGSLQNDEYNLDWSPTGAEPVFTIPLGTPSPAPQSTLNFLGVFSDAVFDSTPVTYAFADYGSGYAYFVQVPKADVNLGPAMIFDPAYAQTSRRDLQWQSVSASRQGVVAYDHRSQALIHFTVDNPGAVSTMTIGTGSNIQTAQSQDGSYCVVWDIDTRVLTRYEKWW